MPIKFNINNAIDLFYLDGGTTEFKNSLKQTLNYLQNDNNISNIKEASYLLATAKAEADYSLQRWESDYLCGKIGKPYHIKPCEKALNYYRSSNNKQNYYNLGTDKNGLPYFGRGLIQLTGKDNYEKYGRSAGLGNSLVIDSNQALLSKNSYKIASAYLRDRTFKYVNTKDFTKARKSVNGGVKSLDKVNKEYDRWIKVFENPKSKFADKGKFWTKTNKIILGLVIVATIGMGSYFLYKSAK